MGQKIKRITQCGHCGKNFPYLYDPERVPENTTTHPFSCPFCHVRQYVPVQAVRSVVVLRDGSHQEIDTLEIAEHPIGVPVAEDA